jgi:hypothetical protein
MKSCITLAAIVLATVGFVNASAAALPDPGVTIVPGRTALLITDPQNDFLSPKGVTWGVVGKSVTDNNTVENIDSRRITTTRPITAGSSKVHSKP